MAQVLTTKRRGVAFDAVTASEQLVEAASKLNSARLEQAQSGNFTDADLEDPNLQHLTPYLIGLVLSTLVPELEVFLDAKISGDPGLPTRREVLLQMLR